MPGHQNVRGTAVVALTCLARLLSEAEAADTRTDVTLIRDGASIALADVEPSRIARRVETLIVGCAIISVTAPDLFAARALAKEWRDVRAGSHLYVRRSSDT